MTHEVGVAGTKVRLATFNIRHGRGLDGRVDLERTARVIRDLDADLLALQEIDRFFERSGNEDQVEVLSRLTGYRLAFGATFSTGDSAYGIALATRTPVDAAYISLPRAGREEPRGVMVARTLGATFLATHLSAAPEARRLQIEALARQVGAIEGPVALLGDLNASRRELGPLVDAGLGRPGWRPLTSPARFPIRQIDHILAGGGARVIERGKAWSRASDHLPALATLVFD